MNLKVKSKKVNDFTYELSISVPWKDLKEDFESAKKKTSKEIKVSGFRKGKIPDNILMSQYLPNIEYTFVQDFCGPTIWYVFLNGPSLHLASHANI